MVLSQTRAKSIHHAPAPCRVLPSIFSIGRTTTVVTPQRSFASAQERPFKVLGLQQIAIGSLDKKLLSNIWTNILGVPKIGNYKSEKENVDEDILLLGKKGDPLAIEVDLMMPIDPEKSPKVHVPPLNHIGLFIDDLPAAVTWMESQGVRFAPGGVSLFLQKSWSYYYLFSDFVRGGAFN